MMLAFSDDSNQSGTNVEIVSAVTPGASASPDVVDLLAPGRKMAAERAILGFVHDLRKFKSVVDFGCGLGNWLHVARELGATETRGYDTPEIPAGARRLATTEFFAADLTRFIPVERRFDVAICLETADQLSPDAAVPLVKTLCAAADWVLFSAALPFQEGNHHAGENWMEYWAGLFSREKFLCYDILRSVFWRDRDIAFYLRQNTCLYVRKDAQDALRARGFSPTVCPPSLIHPELFLKLMSWLSNRHASSTDSRAYVEDLTSLYGRPRRTRNPRAEHLDTEPDVAT
jgi:SAM-dependent methyltransferase